MAKRTPPPARRLANLDPSAIPTAIKKLERRIADLRAAAPTSKDDLSSTVESLCTKVNNTLADVFGLDTVEYDRADVFQSRFYVPRVVAWGGAKSHGPNAWRNLKAAELEQSKRSNLKSTC